jgi:hypothetical protein
LWLVLRCSRQHFVSCLVNEVERVWREDVTYRFSLSAFAWRVAGVPSEIQNERSPNTSLSEHIMVFQSFTPCSIVQCFSTFVRRGPGPNKSTRKYHSNFF